MRRADYIIDLGPGAGIHGGEVVASGTLKELMTHANSITAQSLREIKTYPVRGKRRPVAPGRKEPALVLSGATRHTLKKLTVSFPLQRFICLTGVSGSGKSTLLRECLLPAVQAKLARKPSRTAATEGVGTVSGTESLRAVYEVDQSPIGRTLRSVPATYVGFFDEIRQLFAQTPEARLRGYTSSRFSFNSAQGRCPECLGAGIIKLEMSFMPPAFVRCETCQGARFNLETLDILFHGLNIAQVLDLSVAQALEIFAPFARLARALTALRDTGLDYLKLGQSSPTLSGGEAQRMKLVTHLLTGFRTNDEAGARGCLFLLEEPTIGLHAADIKRLVDVLQRLVDAGHTVVVIEHNLEMIAEADWVIDLGPEAGAQGGRIVCQGTPEAVAKSKSSHTGRYLRKLLQ
jgi:excinuclease ABC subunit A